MTGPYPKYFAVAGRPVKVVATDEVRVLDLATGAMIIEAGVTLAPGVANELSRHAYQQWLDELRQPILERYATAALAWEATGDPDIPYRASVDGHELTIRQGDFPDEALYILRIDGEEVYEVDDWPAAWTKPRSG